MSKLWDGEIYVNTYWQRELKKHEFLYVKLTNQLLFDTHFQIVDQRMSLIHGTKHHKGNQLDFSYKIS